jgi:hypothetical protein
MTCFTSAVQIAQLSTVFASGGMRDASYLRCKAPSSLCGLLWVLSAAGHLCMTSCFAQGLSRAHQTTTSGSPDLAVRVPVRRGLLVRLSACKRSLCIQTAVDADILLLQLEKYVQLCSHVSNMAIELLSERMG